MALTKVTYSMIEGAPVNVLDFGADSTRSLASFNPKPVILRTTFNIAKGNKIRQ